MYLACVQGPKILEHRLSIVKLLLCHPPRILGSRAENFVEETTSRFPSVFVFPPINTSPIPTYPTTNGRSRSSHSAICLSLAPPALFSLHSLPLHPKQQVLHSSSRPAQHSPVTSGTADLRLSTQSSRRATLATRTEKTKACLPRRSSRRSRSSLAAPATV